MNTKSKWFLTYSIVFLLGVGVLGWIHASTSGLPTRSYMNLVTVIGLTTSITGLTIAVAAKLYGRDYRFWLIARIIGAIFALWLIGGSVYLFSQLILR